MAPGRHSRSCAGDPEQDPSPEESLHSSSVSIWLPRQTRSHRCQCGCRIYTESAPGAPPVLRKGLLLGQQIIHSRSPANIWRCSENNQMGPS